MYGAKAVSISFSGSSRSYTYSVPERLQHRWLQKGSRVIVLSPISGPEVVRVNEVFDFRPKSSYVFIKDIYKYSVSPSPEVEKVFKKKRLEEEFDALFAARVGRLTRRQKRDIIFDKMLFKTSEMVKFSSIN